MNKKRKIMVVRKPEWGIPKTLREMGHEVNHVDFVDIINKKGREYCQNYILSESKNYEAVVICKGAWKGKKHTLQKEFLKKLTNKTLTVFWMHDAILNSSRYMFAKMAACCTMCSSPYLTTLRVFEQFGAKRINQIYQGFEEDWCQKRDVKKIHDVTFIGSIYGNRGNFINFLHSKGIKVFNKKCSHEESAHFYNASKVCLNLVPGECFSNRAIRVMGSGAFLYSQMNRDLNVTFKNGKELVLWNNKKQLLNGIKYWLQHDKEREDIANTGYKAIQAFSWANQMKKLLRVIDGEIIREGSFKG